MQCKYFPVDLLLLSAIFNYLIILYTTKPQKPKFLGLISSIYSDNRYDYSMMEATVPDPTVRPPSRIANLRPSSIATGWISSTVICNVISRHAHLCAFRKLANTCYVCCSEVELRTDSC